MKSISLIRRETDKAYTDSMLWLPKQHISEASVKSSLESWVVEQGVPRQIRLWRETDTHLICPRMFIQEGAYGMYGFPFVDLMADKFERTNLKFRGQFQPRSESQARALQALLTNKNGIFNLKTGGGKTVLTFARAVHDGGPLLVVANNLSVLDLWKKEILKFLDVTEDDIGTIRGPEFDWKKPIVLAMIHSLAARSKEQDIPVGFDTRFALTVFDEVHHLSAPLFIETAPLSKGPRIGLTATAERTDGLEFIYQFHLGRVFYKDVEVDLQPIGHFHETDLTLTEEDRKKCMMSQKNGDVYERVFSVPKLRSFLATNEDFLLSRERVLRHLLAKGKKVIAVGHSKELLKALHKRFPGSALIIQDVNAEDRNESLYASQLAFIIAQLGTESINDVKVDTFVALTPFTSPVMLNQSRGRICRINPEDPNKRPEYHIIHDVNIPELSTSCMGMKFWFRKNRHNIYSSEVKNLG